MQSGVDGHLPTCLFATATIEQALTVLDSSALNIVLVVDTDGRLAGVVTDGDLRRAFLTGATLTDLVAPFVTIAPATVQAQESRSSVLDLMLSRRIEQVPIVDDNKRLVGLHLLRDLLSNERRDNAVLVLAGGRGSRLGSLTTAAPKPMMKVAGRPILERLIDHIVGFGLRDITVAVSYLADQIVDYFGDGSQLGCEIRYQFEDEAMPRGTGGPFIDFVQSRPLADPVLVLNGDLVTGVDLGGILDDLDAHQADLSVATHRYTHEVQFGVVNADSGGWVTSVREKPLMEVPINAGVYAIRPEVAQKPFPQGCLSMMEIIASCLAQGARVRSFNFESDWIDVGTPESLALARGLGNPSR